mmetsp:Transcript_11793/g.21860  ORF Transcript_11793/g.21860 Transcript_11793/m.21860 type:complete len:168 (-) Transcript_11793:668-1171(-)
MNREPSHYEVLGLKQDCSTEEVKAAFRNLAKKTHPDVAQGKSDPEAFREAMEAAKVLSSPFLRSAYDLRIGIDHGAKSKENSSSEHNSGSRFTTFDNSSTFRRHTTTSFHGAHAYRERLPKVPKTHKEFISRKALRKVAVRSSTTFGVLMSAPVIMCGLWVIGFTTM